MAGSETPTPESGASVLSGSGLRGTNVLLHHALQVFERQCLHHVTRRLRLENGLLACEWVDPLPLFRGWLTNHLQLEEARNRENARPFLAEAVGYQALEPIENRSHLLARKPGPFCNRTENLASKWLRFSMGSRA